MSPTNAAGGSEATLNEHNLAQDMVAQHEARPEQGIGCRFEMTGDPVDEMKVSAIYVRVDESPVTARSRSSV